MLLFLLDTHTRFPVNPRIVYRHLAVKTKAPFSLGTLYDEATRKKIRGEKKFAFPRGE